ncbi:isochorismatase family cysteine hydrolase [Variovorax sp. JS1663]|uniref:isochorismatase family cysteine hydrolase n=1 Tax=Variovorax sp. JS1663 TaxID=1851577 RepID=UPI001EDE792B|nr:isochorismatase family cysteine hydrolase [Variovorax sp. JS1663]
MLIVDMISFWDFVDADKLLPGAAAIAPRIARLKARARKAGVPVIYANDNAGRWRSDFRALVKQALETEGPGADVALQLMPEEDDFFVLKPKQSAFFGTPLELLLDHLEADRLVLTGVASDQCILVTAAEAVMRDLQVVTPADCVASQTRERNRLVLRQLEDVHDIPTTMSSRLRLGAR